MKFSFSLKKDNMNLYSEFKNLLEKHEKLFAKKISEKYNLPFEEVLATGKGEGNNEKAKTCKHVFKRGKKKNCRCKIKVTSGTFCKKHERKKKLVMRKHKFFTNLFFHAETGFLVRSKEEGVIGKIGESDGMPKIISLTNEDKEICKQWRLFNSEASQTIETSLLPPEDSQVET